MEERRGQKIFSTAAVVDDDDSRGEGTEKTERKRLVVRFFSISHFGSHLPAQFRRPLSSSANDDDGHNFPFNIDKPSPTDIPDEQVQFIAANSNSRGGQHWPPRPLDKR